MKAFNYLLLVIFGLLSLASFAFGHVTDGIVALQNAADGVDTLVRSLPNPYLSTTDQTEPIDFLAVRAQRASVLSHPTVAVPVSAKLDPRSGDDGKTYNPEDYPICDVGQPGWWCAWNRGTYCKNGIMYNRWTLNQGRGDCNDRSSHCYCPLKAAEELDAALPLITAAPMKRQGTMVADGPDALGAGAARLCREEPFRCTMQSIPIMTASRVVGGSAPNNNPPKTAGEQQIRVGAGGLIGLLALHFVLV